MSEERRGSAVDEGERPPEPEEPEPGPRFPPVLYPLAAILGGAIVVWSLSRILLAIDPDYAVAVATLGAINVLIAAALVAYGPRVRGAPAAWPLVAGALGALVLLGVIAAVVWGDRGPEMLAEERKREQAAVQRATLVAKDLAFDPQELSFAAESTVELTLDNQDAGIEHNFALYTDESATEALFAGPRFPGVAQRTSRFTAPEEPGDYFFRCDVHPTQMTGRFVVSG